MNLLLTSLIYKLVEAIKNGLLALFKWILQIFWKALLALLKFIIDFFKTLIPF
jgi:hypothetical protein